MVIFPGLPDSFGQCPQCKIACRIPSNLICMITNQFSVTRTDKFDDTKSVDNSVILCAIHKVEPGLNSGEFSRHDDVKIVALRPLQRNPCQCLHNHFWLSAQTQRLSGIDAGIQNFMFWLFWSLFGKISRDFVPKRVAHSSWYFLQPRKIHGCWRPCYLSQSIWVAVDIHCHSDLWRERIKPTASYRYLPIEHFPVVIQCRIWQTIQVLILCDPLQSNT